MGTSCVNPPNEVDKKPPSFGSGTALFGENDRETVDSERDVCFSPCSADDAFRGTEPGCVFSSFSGVAAREVSLSGEISARFGVTLSVGAARRPLGEAVDSKIQFWI